MDNLAKREPVHAEQYKEVLTNEIMRILNSMESSNYLHEQEIKQLKGTAKKVLTMLSVTCAILTFAVFVYLPQHSSEGLFSSNDYQIQDLRGDKINTWHSWNPVPNQVIHVNIVNQAKVSQEKINVVKDSILSNKSIELSNALFQANTAGSTTYYAGWEGALQSISGQLTKFYIPTNFDITEIPQNVGDITIYLVSGESPDGLSGFTQSVTDGNQILRSKITIFQANLLPDNELGAITRHEFGHALGLAHSTTKYDLMYPTIQIQYPYISQCDLQAVSMLYAGDESSQVVCYK